MAFEDFVNTELPRRISTTIPAGGNLPTGYYLKTTGVGLNVETVMSPTLVTPSTFYVDGSAGDDANDGLAWGTAKRTFGFLLDLPKLLIQGATITINFRNTIFEGCEIGGFVGEGEVLVQGEVTVEDTGTTTGWDNLVTSVTYRQYLTDATKAWVVDEHKGRFVRIVAGTGADSTKYYPIMSNTADTLQFIGMDGGDNLAGDSQYEIVSVPEIMGSTQASPLVPINNALYIHDCTVPITFKFATLDYGVDTFWDAEILYCTGEVRVENIHVSKSNPIYFQGIEDGSIGYSLLECSSAVGGIPAFNCTQFSIRRSCIIGDGNTYGFFDQGCTVVTLMENRFEDHLIGVSPWSNDKVWWSGYSIFRNCTTAIENTFEAIHDIHRGGRPDRILIFENNTTCYNSRGGFNGIALDTQVNLLGNITEVQCSPTQTFTFAEWLSGDAPTNLREGSVFRLYDNVASQWIAEEEYDNTDSDLSAITYQSAIDELANVAFTEHTVQTIDATTTNISTVAFGEEETRLIKCKIVAQETSDAERACYEFAGLFYRPSGGNLTQQGATQSLYTIESDAAYDADFNINGNTLEVQVTGVVGDTINWKCILENILITDTI